MLYKENSINITSAWVLIRWMTRMAMQRGSELSAVRRRTAVAMPAMTIGKKGEEDIFAFSPIDSVCVSQYYTDKTYCGDSIPRIVVLSLSAPKPSMPTDEDNTRHLNPHWRETLAMVRSLLHPFIAPEKFPKPIRNWDDEDITIVESLFVHARTAKCCSTPMEERKSLPKCTRIVAVISVRKWQFLILT